MSRLPGPACRRRNAPLRLLAAAAAAASSASSAQSVDGVVLQILWCDAAAPRQQWLLGGADGTVRLRGNASYCVTSVDFGSGGERTLAMAPCGAAGAVQSYASYSPSTFVDATGQAWNDQWASSVQGAGGFTRLWPNSSLGFNSFFTYDAATGLIEANSTQPGNATMSGLCVTAVPPPPPVPPPVPTAAQAAWQQNGEVSAELHGERCGGAGNERVLTKVPPPPPPSSPLPPPPPPSPPPPPPPLFLKGWVLRSLQ